MSSYLSGLRCAAAAFCLLASLRPALAQLPAARLLTVFPPGATAGADVEVTVGGIDLDDAESLRFSCPGIRADKARGPTKFTIHVAPEVPVGTYEVRVIGRYGVSNSRAFVVGGEPEISTTPHHTPTGATELPCGTTVNAVATASADDWFKISARKGQRLLIECAAREIDSRFEPVLTLIDSDGREVRHARRSGLLDVVAPADGSYTLRVHDLLYRGGPEYFYRLRIGDGPHIDFIFPPAAVRGSKEHFTIFGRNLPGGTSDGIAAEGNVPLERLETEIGVSAKDIPVVHPIEGPLSEPIAAALDGMIYRLQTDRGVSNTAAISFAAAPVVIAQGANINPAEAQQVSPPCEVVGRFPAAQERAWYAFDAKKGDVYRVEAYCDRIGFRCDPLIRVERVVRDDKGHEQAADVQEIPGGDPRSGDPQFPQISRDPALQFEAKQDGTYRLEIRDLFHHPTDEGIVYRLAIRREHPDFRVVALPEAPPPLATNEKPVAVWNPLLRRGGTVPIHVLVLRQDGFSGYLELHAEGLPEGVSCPAVHVPGDATAATLLLSAGESAAGWAGRVRCVAKSVGTPQIEHEAISGTVVWGAADPSSPARSRCTAELVLAVSGSESEPLSIRAGGDAPLEASAAGKVQVPFKIIRRGDYHAAMKLRAIGLPRGQSGKEVDLGPVDSGTYELDMAPLKLPPGSYAFALQAVTQGKYARGKEAAKDVTAAFYSNPVAIQVKR